MSTFNTSFTAARPRIDPDKGSVGRGRLGALLGLLLLLGLITTGCGMVETDPPPLEVTTRDSFLNQGKIVMVKNISNEPVTGIEITLRAPNGEERVFAHPKLEGFEPVEVGWKKLDGWKIPAGTKIEVSAEGFYRSVSGEVPE